MINRRLTKYQSILDVNFGRVRYQRMVNGYETFGYPESRQGWLESISAAIRKVVSLILALGGFGS